MDAYFTLKWTIFILFSVLCMLVIRAGDQMSAAVRPTKADNKSPGAALWCSEWRVAY